MEKQAGNKLGITTALIVIGILLMYIAQTNPSALLVEIMDDLGINMAQGGFGISIVFLTCIVFSLLGPYIQHRIGLKNMYVLTLLVGGVGIALSLFATSYVMFLFSRAIYGAGFGLGIPFFGAAIMHWYSHRQQEAMNTINALFPFIGGIAYLALSVPLMKLFGGSWRLSLAFWGFLSIVVLMIWIVTVKNEGSFSSESAEIAEETAEEAGIIIYFNLIRRRESLILIIAIVSDFIAYAIVAGLLPTYYELEAGYSIETANSLALIFPGAAIPSGLFAYWHMARTGRRKGLIVFGQLIKVAGTVMFYFGGASLIGLVGIGCIGVGCCIWFPALYLVPMELERMTPTLVGAAHALISSFGFASGLISPAIAGWMGDIFSLRLAIFLSALPCMIGTIACLMIRETGPGAREFVR